MTPTVPATSPAPPTADPFAIGWREVRQQLPDGRTVINQVPLTLQDALHPQEGDVIVMNSAHNRDWRYLQDVLERRVVGEPTALVLGDCKVLWEDGVHHSPDLSVFFGVRRPRDFWSEFDVAAEGVRPRLIVEVVSPSTRVNDVETKVMHYHRYKVPAYVIVDRPDEDSPPKLIGYEYRPGRYRAQAAEDDGRLWLGAVGIFLGVRENRVVAFDGDTGAELGDYLAVSAALETEQARADAEQARADAEQARADAEKQRADSERQRADAAETRSAADRQRADAAEARARQLEADLRALQPPPGQ